MEIILEFLGKNKFSLLTKAIFFGFLLSLRLKLFGSYQFVKIVPKADDFQNQAQPLEYLARSLNLAIPFLTLLRVEDANKTAVTAFDNNLNPSIFKSDPSPSNIELKLSTKLSTQDMDVFSSEELKPRGSFAKDE
uniref:Uncharacterized protein n=1 Tax=Brassica oleracea TaxID=3712 RepID=A0A3P6DGX5_BRAOL|nr:unnamed protein product [Brassica oleracea]